MRLSTPKHHLCNLPPVQQTVSVQVISSHLVHVVGVVVLVVIVVQAIRSGTFTGLEDHLVHHRLVVLITFSLLRYVPLVVQQLSSALAFPAGVRKQGKVDYSFISDSTF